MGEFMSRAGVCLVLAVTCSGLSATDSASSSAARAGRFVIPGLIANWMERQGVIQTLCVMTITAVLVRLLLMMINGGNLIR